MQMSGSEQHALFSFREIRHSDSRSGLPVLKGVNLDIYPGSITGLIGPDGGGKSTLIKIACGLLQAEEGAVFKSGKVLAYGLAKSSYAYAPETPLLYPELTVDEHMEIICRLRRIEKKHSLDKLGPLYRHLHPFRHLRAGKLSGGTKQRLSLCCAMVAGPEVLFLDEPTRGMDVLSKHEFWDLLRHWKSNGATILLATSEMDEAINCTDIALFYSGQIMDQGSPEELTSRFSDHLYKIRCSDTSKLTLLLRALRNDPMMNNCYLRGQDIIVRTTKEIAINEIDARVPRYIEETFFTGKATPMIEDVFIKHLHEKHNHP